MQGREHVYSHRRLAGRLRIRTVTVLYGGILTNYLPSKRLRNLSPGEEVYTERKVAFFESVPQLVKLPGVFFSGKCHQVEVGVFSGVAPYAGTVRPDRYTGQVGLQQIHDHFQVLRRKVDGFLCPAIRFYSHSSPEISWYKFVASRMKASIWSSAALAFSPL